MNRRQFLQVSGCAGGGLILSFCLLDQSSATSGAEAGSGTPPDANADFEANAWLRISENDTVTFILDRSEMGQGVLTALPALMAEELDIDPERLTVESAPANHKYINASIGIQATGGSSSVRMAWQPLREAGAQCRALLIAAAAKQWNVSTSECKTENGRVVHAGSSRSFTYGQLAKAAAQFKPNEINQIKPILKERSAYRYVGQSLPRRDNTLKVTGKAIFGIDLKLPGMVCAVIIRPPTLGDKLISFTDEMVKKNRGYREAFAIPQGVAVVAQGYWEAHQAASKIQVKWDSQNSGGGGGGGGSAGAPLPLSSSELHEDYLKLSEESGKTTFSSGDFSRAMKSSDVAVDAVYEMPFLAHATMEPQNFTAQVLEDRCEIWGPTQAQGAAQEVAAQITGFSRDKVIVHTTFLGGGFGRRLCQDFVAEAVEVAKRLSDRVPVKVMWSREDDIRNDCYRPASLHVLKAGLDKTGRPRAHSHRIVAQSILAQIAPQWVPVMAPGWIPTALRNFAGWSAGQLFSHGLKTDPTVVEGGAEIPYAIDNQHNSFVCAPTKVPIGFWRSVGHSYNAFIVESFIDELAFAAKLDPFLFRLNLLGNAAREREVLKLAAAKSGWLESGTTTKATGTFRGIAQHSSFSSYCAQVVEVRIGTEKQIVVERVVCAIDCGFIVNPDIVTAQVESAVIFGLSAALKGEITFKDGQVEQSNFHDYQVVRMNEAPKIEVHFVESNEPPTGVGEIGVPPIGPAVANAVFAATQTRLRKMPLRLG